MQTPRRPPLQRSAAARAASFDHLVPLHMTLHSILCRRTALVEWSELRVDSSEITSLQMDSAPDSPPTASTNMINLWQNNMVATKVERFFGAKVVGSNAVAMITSANYTGGSPS